MQWQFLKNRARSRGLRVVAVLFVLTGLSAQGPAPLVKFRFEAAEQKTLPGNSSEKNKGHGCKGEIRAEDQIGDFAVVALFYQNACYTDANYSHKNYKAEYGTAVSSDGRQRFPAVRVFPPQSKAGKFLASNHVGYYRSAEQVAVYQLDAGMLNKAFTTSAAGALAGGFRKVEGFNMSRIDQPLTYVFIAASQNYSAYQKTGETEAARIFSDATFTVDKYRIGVKGKVFDTARNFNFGPETHQAIYGHSRSFFTTESAEGITILWQDELSDDVYASRVSGDFSTHRQQKLAAISGHQLAAATADRSGNLYYVLIEKSKNSGAPSTRRVTAIKADINGKILKRTNLDASAKGLNITGFGDSYLCSFAYSNGRLGLILSRTMHRSNDGLHHQGAIAVVLDAATLAVVKNLGQTSGHSFGNYLTTDSAGKFLAIDLGDNYPRGVHLHRFDETGRESRLVYTFKTEHGTSARSPAGRSYPVYAAISGGGKTFYQWSNDNHTYSEIGGAHDMQDGIAVFFAGEPDAAGKSLNNARTGANHNDARNLGMVFVKRDFSSGDPVLSKGVDESGGFYSFGGTFTKQENKGILWLTRYTDKSSHNVSRVKTAALDGSRVLVIHEIWTGKSYSSTQLTLFHAPTGGVYKSVNLGPILQLGWHDDLIVKDGKVYAVSGNGVDDKIEIAVISVR
jgi:hypothetical protein